MKYRIAIIKEFLHFLFCQKKSKDIRWFSYLSLDFYIDYVFYKKPESMMNLVCRMKGHPNGVGYYTSGFEPDMTCKDCGEDLG
jgi:hypothetical protein